MNTGKTDLEETVDDEEEAGVLLSLLDEITPLREVEDLDLVLELFLAIPSGCSPSAAEAGHDAARLVVPVARAAPFEHAQAAERRVEPVVAVTPAAHRERGRRAGEGRRC